MDTIQPRETLLPEQAAQMAADFSGIAIVVFIILFAGIVGGWAAYLTAGQTRDGSFKSPVSRLRFILLGVVASACVPLFLSLVQSNLVSAIFTADRAHPFEQYLVFLGLCLIAAFSARSFIDSISRRIIRELEEVKEEQEDIKLQVQETTELVDEQRAEPLQQQGQAEAALVDRAAIPDTDDIERRALQALTKLTFRTATGIAADIGVPRNRIGEVLDSLHAKGLVILTQSPTTKGPRWKIAPAGIAAINTP